MIVFLLLMCMPCILIVINFSMSMLSFIEDNKKNEHGGGSFLENLEFFKIFVFLYLVFYACSDF